MEEAELERADGDVLLDLIASGELAALGVKDALDRSKIRAQAPMAQALGCVRR